MPRQPSKARAEEESLASNGMVAATFTSPLAVTLLNGRWPLLFFPETDFIYNYLHIVQ